jgi:hypothetical protein
MGKLNTPWMTIEELVIGKCYLVDPMLRIPRFMPTVKIIDTNGSLAIVRLSNGTVEALAPSWLLCEATALMEALF